MAKLTTHVLNIASDTPAAGMRIDLRALSDSAAASTTVQTNADGRCAAPLLEGAAFRTGRYSLTFHVAAYFRSLAVALPEPPFLDEVVIAASDPVPTFIFDGRCVTLRAPGPLRVTEMSAAPRTIGSFAGIVMLGSPRSSLLDVMRDAAARFSPRPCPERPASAASTPAPRCCGLATTRAGRPTRSCKRLSKRSFRSWNSRNATRGSRFGTSCSRPFRGSTSECSSRGT